MERLVYKSDCKDVDWDEVIAILKSVDMSTATPQLMKQSFEGSYSKVFVYKESNLIGFGRLISDGIRQSAIYDLAIRNEYQGIGLGSKILELLMGTTPSCNFILYAAPGKETFYQKKGFKKMKTGMILFENKERMNDERFVE